MTKAEVFARLTAQRAVNADVGDAAMFVTMTGESQRVQIIAGETGYVHGVFAVSSWSNFFS